MDLTISDLLIQNSPGNSEGFPAGVPPSYNWYQGWNDGGQWSPPADFTAVEGWGQVYPKVGAPLCANADAAVEVANAKTYVHMKHSGEWALVQDQSRLQLTGGHFVSDFSGNAAIPMKATPVGTATISFAQPPAGYNNHFWYKARGTYPADAVDAVYIQMDMKVTDPTLYVVAMVGADWWRDARAPFLDDHSNNPGIGGTNWIELSTHWKTIGFYSMSAETFRANPAPPLRSPASEMPRVQPPLPLSMPARSGDATNGMSPDQPPRVRQETRVGAHDGSLSMDRGYRTLTEANSQPLLATPIMIVHSLSNDGLLVLALALAARFKVSRTASLRARTHGNRIA